MNDKGWTQTPNFILDNMAEMKPTVFKVCMVVVRQTCGYIDEQKNRKEWDRLSTSRIMQLSGLSNRTVIDAVEEAIAQGWIERRPSGQYFEYRVSPMKKVHKFSDEQNETCEESSQVNEKTCEDSSQVTYENSSQVDQTYEEFSQEPMKNFHTQKKEENKDISSTKTQRTMHQSMFEKVCSIVGWDYKTLGEKSRGQVAQTLGILKKAGYTLDDLNNFGPQIWVHDWRWEKQHQYPTLEQLKQEIGKLRAKGFQTNGAIPQAPNVWYTAFDNPDEPEYLRRGRLGLGPEQ